MTLLSVTPWRHLFGPRRPPKRKGRPEQARLRDLAEGGGSRKPPPRPRAELLLRLRVKAGWWSPGRSVTSRLRRARQTRRAGRRAQRPSTLVSELHARRYTLIR